MMELSTTPTATTVTVTGDLDLAERAGFAEVDARVAAAPGALLVLDLCETTFLDSTGAAFLVSLAEAARRRGTLAVLRGAAERDLFVLRVCGGLDSFRVDRQHHCRADGDLPDPWRPRHDGAQRTTDG